MRLLRYSCLVLGAVLCILSCSEKAGRKEIAGGAPAMALEGRDTTAVYGLAKQFLELLKAEKVDEAVSMLYFLDGEGRIVPLPDTLAVRQKAVFRAFPVLGYRIDSIIFSTETDSQVKYTIEFFKKQPGDTRPNTTSFYIKPMRVKGRWYLTMFDSNTYNGGDTSIRN